MEQGGTRHAQLIGKAAELLERLPVGTRDKIGTGWIEATTGITKYPNTKQALFDCLAKLEGVTHDVITVLADGGITDGTRQTLTDFADVVTQLKRDTFDRVTETL